MASEDDIHTPDNFELSAKLSNNNLNTVLFRNYRLERIKPRQKLSEPVHMLSQEDWHTEARKTQTKTKAGTGSQGEQSQHTVYQSHFRNSMGESREKRIYTSNPGTRKLRRKDYLLRQSITQHESFVRVEPPTTGTSERKNIYCLLERKNNKGGRLEIKNMENWLNDILVEYCYKQKFDMTITHPALKKFMIDRNCLLSKGLGHDQIDRIYRSLFVYSIGFNKLLEELSSNRDAQSIRKTLWRVYANLLEYCAKGEFETMLVNIQHDRDEDMKKMRYEIAKRQELIDNIDRNNREKNEKIVKKLYHLYLSNANLKQERDYIEEDLKQVDQAFNQEVSLRLKFYHKINEIHGVHRELEMKHIRLLDDFSNYKKDFQQLQQERQNDQERVEKLTLANQELNAIIDGLKLELQDRTTRMETLEYSLSSQTQKALLLESKIEDASSEDNHRYRYVALLKFEVENLQGMIQHRMKAEEEQKRQIGVLVGENRQMYNRIDEQKLRIGALLQEQSNFSQATLNLKTRLEHMEGKFQEKAREFDELNTNHRIMKDKLSSVEDDLQLSSERNKLLQSDIDNFIVNVRAMKKAKGDIEDDLNELRKQNKTMLEIIQGNYTSMASLTNKLAETTEELTRTKSALLDTEAQLKFKEDSFNRDKIRLTKDNEKLKVERDELTQIDKDRGEKMKQLETYTEKCKKEMEKAEAGLRDEKFYRDNLQLQFKTSLMEVVGEKEVIKKLNIDISRMEQYRDEVIRHLKAKEFALVKLNETYNQEVTMLNKVIDQQKAYISGKRMYVHPMHYHEVYSRLVRENNLHQGSYLAYQTLREYIKLMQENTHRNHILALQQLYERKKEEIEYREKLLFSKDKYIEHIRNKIGTTSERIEQLESSLKAYELAGTTEDPKIKQLHQELKAMEAKLEQISTQNKGLQQRNSDLNTNLILKDNELKEQKKQLDDKSDYLKKIIVAHEEERKYHSQLQQTLKQQLSQQQDDYKLLLAYLTELKDYQLPEKRPSRDIGNYSEIKKLTESSQQEIHQQQQHQKTNSNSNEKQRENQRSGTKSHPPKNRQNSGDKVDSHETIKKSEKSQTAEYIAGIAQTNEYERERRRAAYSSRRDIVRKLRGATTYYSGVRRD